MKRLAARIVLGAVTIAVLVASLLPAPPTSRLGWDKANHVAALAAITMFAYLAFLPSRRALCFAGFYSLALGIVIELAQAFCTTSRTAEWGDLAADAVGTTAVMVLVAFLHRNKVFQ